MATTYDDVKYDVNDDDNDIVNTGRGGASYSCADCGTMHYQWRYGKTYADTETYVFYVDTFFCTHTEAYCAKLI
eukprot:16435350-Heterocapsa_arctica.AAC.1